MNVIHSDFCQVVITSHNLLNKKSHFQKKKKKKESLTLKIKWKPAIYMLPVTVASHTHSRIKTKTYVVQKVILSILRAGDGAQLYIREVHPPPPRQKSCLPSSLI